MVQEQGEPARRGYKLEARGFAVEGHVRARRSRVRLLDGRVLDATGFSPNQLGQVILKPFLLTDGRESPGCSWDLPGRSWDLPGPLWGRNKPGHHGDKS